MEVIGAISSVAGTAAIVAKLAEGIIQLIRLWHKIEDVPESIGGILNDLNILSSLLKQAEIIQDEPEYLALQGAVLENCAYKIWRLQKLIAKKSRGWEMKKGWKRKWADLNLVLREEEIRDLRTAIHQATSLLQLLLGVSTSKAVHQILDILREAKPSLCMPALIELRDCVPDRINLESTQTAKHPKSTATKIESLVNSTTDLNFSSAFPEPALVRHRSCVNPLYPITRELESYYWKRQRGYLIYPPNLLRKIGLNYGMHLTSGWQYSLQVFRAVPEEALIFDFCRTGNVDAVRSMITRGEASPWDRDPEGRTPLWVAVENLQLDVAEYLLEQGADCHAEGERRVPISLVARAKGSEGTEVAPKIAMIRLLQRYSTTGYRERDIMNLLGSCLVFYRLRLNLDLSMATRIHCVLQFVSHLLPEFELNGPQRTYVLYDLIRFHFDKELLYHTLRYIPGMLEDETEETTSTSCIHVVVEKRILHRDPLSARIIAQKTTNLHRRHKMKYQSRKTTPTSLAMWQSSLFFLWRRLLLDLGVDIPTFVDEEIKAGVLVDDGWTRETLMKVFELDFEPWEGTTLLGFPGCERCGANLSQAFISRMPKDLGWRRILRDLRRGEASNCRAINGQGVRDEDDGHGPEMGRSQRDLPYRIVCSNNCRDDICVSEVFEGETVGELVPFPYVAPDEKPVMIQEEGYSLKDTEERCPVLRIPGAFITDS